MPDTTEKNIWYAGGLHFECRRCGRCCSGPGEGYIWVTKPEIQFIADYFRIYTEELRQKYLKRIGLRTTIIEHPHTKNCIFLDQTQGRNKCIIYPVRPSQCRNWPFWQENLENPAAWNRAAQKCPGVNHGREYTAKEIGRIKQRKKWWLNEK